MAHPVDSSGAQVSSVGQLSPGRPVPRGRLFQKYAVVIAALTSGLLLVSGLVELYFSYQENNAALLNLQHEKALAASQSIGSFVQEVERQMGWAMPPARSIGTTTIDERRDDFFRLLRQVQAITEVSYIDAMGRQQLRLSRLSINATGSEVDHSREPAFREAKPWKTYYGPVYFRRDSEPYFTMGVAEAAPGGGVAIAEVNLKFVVDVVRTTKVGPTGLAYVVDGQGQLISHPDLTLVLKRSDFSVLAQVRDALGGGSSTGAATSPGGKATGAGPDWSWLGAPPMATERVTVGRDLAGSEVLSANAPVEPAGWLVFVEQPVAGAFASRDFSIARNALLLLIGVLVSILAGLVLAGRLTTPIRALQVSASRIGAGALDQRIEVRTGDELESLADEFNRMSAQLRDLYAGLELKVVERTRDLARALDEQTATSEVLATMSRNTRDLRPVLASMLFHAKRLCGAEEGFIFKREGDIFRLEDAFGAPPEVQAALGRLSIGLDGTTLVGRVALDRKPVHIPDVLADREYGDTEAQRRFGYRTLVGVPLLRDDEVIGVLGLGRERMEPFSDAEITLLLTFADQTVIALENVRLFEEIQEKSRQLELASQHKSEFLAHMSHELRTPLNSIIGFSDVLLERMFGPINEKQEEYITDILSSGHHLLSLINDVLDLSKVEAGHVELELSSLWLPEVLETSVGVFRETASRRDIRLDLSIDPRLGPFEADERKLKQILLNLVSNAIKFTPDGGRVEVSSRLLGDVIHIAVRDTGIGVSPEDLERIFDAFQQVRRPGEPREGTGLGLTLTKQFVEMHGGRIWLESAPGLGSTFTFALPVRPMGGPGSGGRDSGEPAARPRQEGWGLRGTPPSSVKAMPEATPLFPATDEERGTEPAATVLAIDDDPMALELVRATLAPAGYRVLQASSPTEGLRLAREKRPALVILDLLMPGMDGFEVVERLRADPATEGVPILVLTAKAVTTDEIGRLRPRISHLADKAGFRTAQFLEIVGRLVGPAA